MPARGHDLTPPIFFVIVTSEAGCGLGTVINGGTGGGQTTTGTGTPPVDPPAPIVCPDGLVAQLVCDPASPTGGGGGVIIIECTGPDCPSPPPPCDPADPDCAPPFPPPGCSFQCVPPGQICPPGTDLVTVCVDGDSGSSGGNGAGGSGAGGSFGGEIPPGDPNTPVGSVTCWTECAPHGCGGGGGGGGETPAEPPISD